MKTKLTLEQHKALRKTGDAYYQNVMKILNDSGFFTEGVEFKEEGVENFATKLFRKGTMVQDEIAEFHDMILNIDILSSAEKKNG